MEPHDRTPGNGNDDDDAGDVFATVVRVADSLRRRWLVVAIVVAFAVASMVLIVSMLRPHWKASTTLVINLTGPQILDTVQGVNDEERTAAAYEQYYETQRAIINSRTIAEAALAGLGLSTDPMFLGVDQIRDEAERARKMEDVDPVERLLDLVEVSEVRNSRVVKISVEYPDAKLAADIANAVADAYLDYVDNSRTQTGSDAKDRVESERSKVKAELAANEAALDAFKSEHEITSISLEDRQNLITQNITTLSVKANEARARRFELGSLLTKAKALSKTNKLASSSLLDPAERVVFNSLLAEQLEAEREFNRVDLRYGERHPEWVKAKAYLDSIESRLQAERKGMLEALEARFEAAKATENKLVAALDAERDKALELSRLEPKYRELEREARTAAEAYAVIAKRDTEIDMTNRVEQTPVSILDRATEPRDPVRPRKLLLLATALLGGLLAGSVLAIAIDFRDSRIRSHADLVRAISSLGLGVLGQLPQLPSDPKLGMGNTRAQRRQRDLHTFLFPQSMMAERCRGVRTSLTFQLNNDGPTVLLVTSPMSAEGKSSTAMNLALSYCQSGKKVMLIDADMRRPRLHQVFPPPVEDDDVGLAAVLSGDAELDQAILTGFEGAPKGLSVMVCGAIPENPAELLESAQARKLVADLRTRFDVVVIDSPPVLPVTDPVILARLVDGVVLVARCQSTTRTALQRAISALRMGDTNLLGVILNEADTRDGRGYTSEYYTYRAKKEPAAVEG